MIYRIFFDTRKKKKKEKRTLFFDYYYINKYNINFPFLLIVRHTHTSSYMSAREESIQITGARQSLGYYIDVRNTTLRRHTYIERHTLTHTSALYYSHRAWIARPLRLFLSLLFFFFRSRIVTTETYISSSSSEWCKNLHLFLILLYMDWLLVAVQWVKLYGLNQYSAFNPFSFIVSISTRVQWDCGLPRLITVMRRQVH